MTSEILAGAERKMLRAVEAMERDFQGFRTGRASTSLVERLTVDYYGTQTPLNQLASISVPEAHQIVIQPWDRGVLSAIEKAILKSDIGLTPNVDGTLVRLGHADGSELVERRLRAVVVDVQALDEARGGATGPQGLEVALHRLDRPPHLALGLGQDLGAHPVIPPGSAEMRVPTRSPRATRVMLSGVLRSNTTIGRSFSMHSETAAASSTLSWSRSRSW